MNNVLTLTAKTNRMSVKTQTLVTLCSIAAAVAIPQLFHTLGALSGLGTALGEVFLPMHLPVIFAGLFAGPYVGAISGMTAPLVSFYLTGMPTSVMLPFMMIELFAYGLFAGILRNVRISSLLKVLIVQLAGRAVRAVAIFGAVYLLGNSSVQVSTIWMSIPKGLFGIILQLAFIPLMLYRVKKEG